MEKEPLLRITRRHVMTLLVLIVSGFIIFATWNKRAISGLWPWALLLGLTILIGLLQFTESLEGLRGKTKP